MSDLFLQAVRLSISASFIVLATVIFHIIFNRVPKKIHCLLWVIAVVRLVVPFSVESIFSLLPDGLSAGSSLPRVAPTVTTPAVPYVEGSDTVDNFYMQAVDNAIQTSRTVQISEILAAVWLGGIAVILLYAIISVWLVKRRIGASAPTAFGRNILVCDYINTPFIFGVINPKIYLPSDCDKTEIPYILRHEKAHLKRLDHLWKPLGFIILAVYWFNPFMWLAYALFCRDMELACDEKVIADMNIGEKKSYTAALLNCSAPKKIISVCPLAFGEVGVKKRIQNVLHYKKPAFWLIIAAAVVCVVIGVCFLTNPMNTTPNYLPRDQRPERITVTTETGSYVITNEAALHYTVDFWTNVAVKRRPLNKNMDDDRDKTNAVVFYYGEDNAVAFYLNADCTEMWCQDFVKPSYTMATKDSVWVHDFFNQNIEQRGIDHTLCADAALLQVSNKDYVIDKYYHHEVIGADRANREEAGVFGVTVNMIYQYMYGQFSDGLSYRGVISRYADDIDGYLALIRETLPLKYQNAKIKASFFLRDEEVKNLYDFVILMQNGDVLGAKVSDYSKQGGKKTVMCTYKLKKKNSTAQSETNSEMLREDAVDYRYQSPYEPLESTLTLYENDQTFSFFYSALSDYLPPTGDYQENDDMLTLNASDGNRYVFKKGGNGSLIFDEAQSSPLPKFKYASDSDEVNTPVPDGAVYRKN